MLKTKVKNETRTDNVMRNASVGLISQVVILIVSFINRTIFIKMLGNDYLSINGLFSNIINTLSFFELGFGTALIYMLYKPVAENDKPRIKTIVDFYKKIYRIIGSFVIVLGILIIPFMGYIIKEPPNIKENLTIIYILFLLSTYSGYFFAHKTAIINANQKNYITTLYSQIGKAIQSIIQIIILVLTKNYILYLIIQLLATLFSNIFISRRANKDYPYLLEKNIKPISKSDRKTIISKVKSLILYRLGPSVLNGSNNLIMSACVGISYVGIYSNYFLIINYINLMTNLITSSFETSIGNLNAVSEKEQKEKVFYKILYICFLIEGIVSILLVALFNDFITIWLGKEYIFSNAVVICIIFNKYLSGMQFACVSYRTTAALFDKTKLMPLYETIICISLSIILSKQIGVAGIFIGASIARILTFFWSDPVIIYKYLFESKNVLKYFARFAYYTLITIFIGTVVFYISSLIPAVNYIYWILKACLLGIITLVLVAISTFKLPEFKDTIVICKLFILKFKNKKC